MIAQQIESNKYNEEFFADFCKVQESIPVIEYNQHVKFKSVNFKYADLPKIHETVKPILKDNNFALTYIVGKEQIECLLIHKSGVVHKNEIEFKPTSDPKQTGSLITYYKRYLISALLAIDTEEDNDAPPSDNGAAVKKVDMTKAAFESAQARITNGEQGVLNKCLAYFNLTEEQNKVLLNLELETNG